MPVQPTPASSFELAANASRKTHTTGELPALGLAEPLPPIALRTIMDLAPEVLADLVTTARSVAREVLGISPAAGVVYSSTHPMLWVALSDLLRFVSTIEQLPPDRGCPMCEAAGRPPYPMTWISDDELYWCATDSHTEAL